MKKNLQVNYPGRLKLKNLEIGYKYTNSVQLVEE